MFPLCSRVTDLQMYAFFSLMVSHRISNVVPGLHYSILLFIPHYGWTCFPSHTGLLALPSCPCLHQIFVLFEWSWPPVYNSFQLWVGERMPLATSTDHGHNLQTVQLLIKKNQVSVSAGASYMLGGREGVRRTDRFSLAPEPDTNSLKGELGRWAGSPWPQSLAQAVCCCGSVSLGCVFPNHIDPPEGDPGAPASHRRHLWEEPEHHHRQQPQRWGHPAETGWPEAAVGPPHRGDWEAAPAAGGGAQGPAVLLWCGWGRGLDERAGAVHDVRREGQGEDRG